MTGKERVALEAVKEVEDHMIIGLGSGTTVNHFIKALAKKVREEKLELTLVSTSKKSQLLAEKEGLIVTDFSLIDRIDVTIDGADEVTKNLEAIKGGGGSLLYEKLVASASTKVIFIVHEEKVVKTLGKFPLAIEVVPFYKEKLFNIFKGKGYHPTYRRKDDGFFLTDGGHHIIDLHLEKISDPKKLHDQLKAMTGVIDTGLFLQMADKVLVAYEDRVEVIDRE